MTPEESRKYLDILEIGPRATLSDIKNAYLRLKKLYSGDSIVLDPLSEEFSDMRRTKIIEEIEDAYAKLLAADKNKPTLTSPPDAASGDAPPRAESRAEDLIFSGPTLRRIREKLGIEIIEISQQLKLRGELIKSIEEERFEALPEEIYLKTHLKNIAVCLSLNPAKVAGDYVARYRDRKKPR
jgi:hypothetical protein